MGKRQIIIVSVLIALVLQACQNRKYRTPEVCIEKLQMFKFIDYRDPFSDHKRKGNEQWSLAVLNDPRVATVKYKLNGFIVGVDSLVHEKYWKYDSLCYAQREKTKYEIGNKIWTKYEKESQIMTTFSGDSIIGTTELIYKEIYSSNPGIGLYRIARWYKHIPLSILSKSATIYDVKNGEYLDSIKIERIMFFLEGTESGSIYDIIETMDGRRISVLQSATIN